MIFSENRYPLFRITLQTSQGVARARKMRLNRKKPAQSKSRGANATPPDIHRFAV
jgi:hypothetical protein